MISLPDAQDFVLGGLKPLTPRPFEVAKALGRVTAEPIESTENVPPFDNTAMDGFAVRSADVATVPVTLDVVGTLAAGARPDLEMGPGQAIRIMTGAPMPPGADAVVMVERTTLSEDASTVEIDLSVPEGNHVRCAGEDMQPGQTVFGPGTELRSGHLGVLNTLGIPQISAHPAPRVGVMSTGDELVDGPYPLEPGQIRDSNRRTLLSLVAEAGAVPVDLGLVRDDEDAITEAIQSGAASCDALLSSGGVSMGAFDYVKVVLDRVGDMRWMQVAIKPAKPLAFGYVGATPMFGLPGNPVSSMVSFELFARPGLRKLMGHSDLHRPLVNAVAEQALTRGADGKTHFARVLAECVDGVWRVRFAGGQGSHQLAAMATANALAVVPDGDGVAEGESVAIMLLG